MNTGEKSYELYPSSQIERRYFVEGYENPHEPRVIIIGSARKAYEAGQRCRRDNSINGEELYRIHEETRASLGLILIPWSDLSGSRQRTWNQFAIRLAIAKE